MQNSFKTRIVDCLIVGAKAYSKLINYVFVFESPNFKYNNSYKIRFTEANFMHLTGVSSDIAPIDFFEKCLNGTISSTDFGFGHSNERKGYVRKKIKHISDLEKIVTLSVNVEEQYRKGKIIALLALSNGEFTMAFTGGEHYMYPMSLLDHDLLHYEDKQINTLMAKRISLNEQNFNK